MGVGWGKAGQLRLQKRQGGLGQGQLGLHTRSHRGFTVQQLSNPPSPLTELIKSAMRPGSCWFLTSWPIAYIMGCAGCGNISSSRWTAPTPLCTVSPGCVQRQALGGQHCCTERYWHGRRQQSNDCREQSGIRGIRHRSTGVRPGFVACCIAPRRLRRRLRLNTLQRTRRMTIVMYIE